MLDELRLWQLNRWRTDMAGIAVKRIVYRDPCFGFCPFRAQRFGKAIRKNCRSSWTTELARRLLIPMISDNAATAMAIMAMCSGLMFMDLENSCP